MPTVQTLAKLARVAPIPLPTVAQLPAPEVQKGDDLRVIDDDQIAMLPVYDLRLSAGPGAWTEGNDNEPLLYEPYRFDWLRTISAAPPQMLIIARVEGDSMEATLHSGDQVLIDRTRRRATRDGIYGLRRGDDIQVKRVAVDPRSGLLTIISDNPHYPRWDGINPDTIDIIGRVIWLGRQV
jgi:phage repressor protein C with HTH and peptisase S24 domain